MLNLQIDKFGWIQISQTGGQPYSDTSPYEVSECYLVINVAHLHLRELFSK